jgi:LPXTG-site transpeptidase (sortase) family protein
MKKTFHPRELLQPKALSIISGLCIGFFIISMVLIYGPIVQVEANYQYKSILHNVFHVSDLRGLILPQFNFDILATKYPEFGMNIPALYLDEPIIFNVDPYDKKVYQAALKKGIAHAAGTELPGNNGLGYYFAHSSNPDVVSQYNAVFYLLGRLKQGDQIFIWRDKQKYEYIVEGTKVTEPNDVSFIQQHYEKEVIVLQTCWPPGTTQKRMLVFATRK